MSDQVNPLPSSWSFHHLGVACRNIEGEASAWLELGYRQEGSFFIDETQGIKGIFLLGMGPRLELLEDLPGRQTIAPWLEKGVKIYHAAFEVEEIEKEIDEIVRKRARVVVPPVPAVAFDNRRVCFIMLKNLALIELIESANFSF